MTILKGIPRVLPPQLLYTLARMGHGACRCETTTAAAGHIFRNLAPSPALLLLLAPAGDTLVIADANFPAASVASKTPGGLINCDGNDAPTILKAVMGLLPLDPTCPPCQLMQLMPEHKAAGWKTPIWSTYKEIIDAAEGRDVEFVEVERFAFYEEAKKAYAVVTTGEVRRRLGRQQFLLHPLPVFRITCRARTSA